MRNRVVLFLLLNLCLSGVHAGAAMPPDEALSQFVRAGLAYRDGRYEEAIDGYSEIIKGGRENGAVYYNLGNSYFRAGRLGKAILNYERAKRFIPRDSDLNFNAQYAQTQVNRHEPDQEVNFLKRAVQNFFGNYTADEMVLFAAVGLILGGIVFLMSLYFTWPFILSRSALAGCFLIFLLFTIGFLAKTQKEAGLAVTITSSDTYFEPKTDSTVHFKLSEGMKVKILKSEGGWAKVRRLDGKIGWAIQEALELI